MTSGTSRSPTSTFICNTSSLISCIALMSAFFTVRTVKYLCNSSIQHRLMKWAMWGVYLCHCRLDLGYGWMIIQIGTNCHNSVSLLRTSHHPSQGCGVGQKTMSWASKILWQIYDIKAGGLFNCADQGITFFVAMLLDKQPNSSRMVERNGGMGGMPWYLTGMMDKAMENGHNGKNTKYLLHCKPICANWMV